MNMTPEQVGEMSVWQFATVVAAWNKMHAGNATAPPTDEEFEDAMDRVMNLDWALN